MRAKLALLIIFGVVCASVSTLLVLKPRAENTGSGAGENVNLHEGNVFRGELAGIWLREFRYDRTLGMMMEVYTELFPALEKDDGELILMRYENVVYQYKGGVMASAVVNVGGYSYTLHISGGEKRTINGRSCSVARSGIRVKVIGELSPPGGSLGLSGIKVLSIAEE